MIVSCLVLCMHEHFCNVPDKPISVRTRKNAFEMYAGLL